MNEVLYLKVNYVKLKMYSINILHRCISIDAAAGDAVKFSHKRNVQIYFCFFFFNVFYV